MVRKGEGEGEGEGEGGGLGEIELAFRGTADTLVGLSMAGVGVTPLRVPPFSLNRLQ